MEHILAVQCCICKKFRSLAGDGIFSDLPPRGWCSDNVSHGYCPHCATDFKIREFYLNDLLSFMPPSAQGFISERKKEDPLYFDLFEAEVVNPNGFRITFKCYGNPGIPPIHLELQDRKGVIFAEFRAVELIGVSGFASVKFSGMAMPQEQAKSTYNNIVDMLLALPAEA